MEHDDGRLPPNPDAGAATSLLLHADDAEDRDAEQPDEDEDVASMGVEGCEDPPGGLDATLPVERPVDAGPGEHLRRLKVRSCSWRRSGRRSWRHRRG